MLVSLEFSKENESTIKDLLHSVNLDFKLFCYGSLEVVAESLMEKCSNCKEKITLEDAKDNGKMWILFILNKNNDNLMQNLHNTCFIIVKTFQNVRSFFDSERLQCRICLRKKCNKGSLSIEGPVKTVDPNEEERIKREPQDETVEKEKKPVNLGPRLVEIALIKASGIVVKEEKDIKKEEDSDSPKTKRARIEMTEPVDVIKQDQLDESIEQNVETGVYLKTVHMNLEDDREKDSSSERESSELASDDSDFFTENRKRKKFTKKILDSSKCKKRVVQQQVSTHADVSLNRDDPFEEDRYNNEESESSDSNDDDSNKEIASNSLEKKKNFKGKESFECPHCGRQFTSKRDLENHLRIHTGERPFKCRECDSRFTQRSNLNTHVKTVHRGFLGERPFKCPECDGKFTQSGSLRTHIKTVHRGERRYQCLECDAKFGESSSLNKHIKTVHRSEKPFACKDCEKKFAYKLYLENHKRTHDGSKPYQCDVCEMKFSQKITLNRHKLIHTGIKPHECDICGRPFTRLYFMKSHKITHLGMNEKESVE